MDYKYQGQEGKHENVVFQYTHTPCAADQKCLGAANKDQFDLLITGLDQVLLLFFLKIFFLFLNIKKRFSTLTCQFKQISEISLIFLLISKIDFFA